MQTIKLTLEYDGTQYAGWQRQANQPTIQAALELVIGQVAQATLAVVGAGRTDSGVHALGQVASFRTERRLSSEEWSRALNGLLPDDICVRSVEFVPDEFHARYSAVGKLYEYRILNRPHRSALDRDRTWHVRKQLDQDAMRKAAESLIGRQDFSSFQGSPTDNQNPVCHLRRLSIHIESDLIRIEAYADRFLKQMVRAMVGTLVEVGLGKRTAASLRDILAARDRAAAGKTAPAHGLYLVRVDY
ncbi:MAG TPA: tRNA pseudouridine(38-40) synthase TruA [Nitrospiraceae bacterium]|nr:tRNA pseudouridine(38-40) synthase TruA [Nitrospiraceae bacterium]